MRGDRGAIGAMLKQPIDLSRVARTMQYIVVRWQLVTIPSVEVLSRWRNKSVGRQAARAIGLWMPTIEIPGCKNGKKWVSSDELETSWVLQRSTRDTAWDTTEKGWEARKRWLEGKVGDKNNLFGVQEDPLHAGVERVQETSWYKKWSKSVKGGLLSAWAQVPH